MNSSTDSKHASAPPVAFARSWAACQSPPPSISVPAYQCPFPPSSTRHCTACCPSAAEPVASAVPITAAAVPWICFFMVDCSVTELPDAGSCPKASVWVRIRGAPTRTEPSARAAFDADPLDSQKSATEHPTRPTTARVTPPTARWRRVTGGACACAVSRSSPASTTAEHPKRSNAAACAPESRAIVGRPINMSDRSPFIHRTNPRLAAPFNASHTDFRGLTGSHRLAPNLATQSPAHRSHPRSTSRMSSSTAASSPEFGTPSSRRRSCTAARTRAATRRAALKHSARDVPSARAMSS